MSLSVHESVFPVVTLSCWSCITMRYASQGTHAFLKMLPLISRKCVIDHPVIGKISSAFQIPRNSWCKHLTGNAIYFMQHLGPVEDCSLIGIQKWVKCDVTIRHPIPIHVKYNIIRVMRHFGLKKKFKRGTNPNPPNYRGPGLLCICERMDLRRY